MLATEGYLPVGNRRPTASRIGIALVSIPLKRTKLLWKLFELTLARYLCVLDDIRNLTQTYFES